ncbi:hypothetical protein LTR84_009051 [Exophiala bonariae]|uniref:Uncharacterized protein n=1 Tax=Exophiala bonariae TaxID=1690606 RepID=A0AAV9MW05_9EURO|nr:hypothetical protein LTR84_009051 [Exophiala bonariae]
MAPRNRHKKRQVSKESNAFSDVTNNSAMQSNEIFFDNQLQQLQELPELQIAAEPSHSSSITWKSPWVKEKEEYERIRHRVRHFSPAVFKGRRKELFPQDTSEWMEHKRGLAAMNEAGLREDIAHMKELIAIKEKDPKGQKLMKPFGGKVFSDDLSSVLALPTIWNSNNFDPANVNLGANWPSKREAQLYVDGRKNGPANQKNPLPPPKLPGTTLEEEAFIKPWPLDRTGPNQDEIRFYNSLMDNDPEFASRGASLLGSALIGEIGQRTEPTTLERRYANLQTVPEEAGIQHGYFYQDSESESAPEQPLDVSGPHGYARQDQSQGAFYARENEHEGIWYGPNGQGPQLGHGSHWY